MPRPILSRSWFWLLLGFGLILADNWVWPSNARTANWQGTDCVPFAHVELQTVWEPFTAASCNTAARFKSLLVLAAPGYRPDFGWKLGWAQLCKNCQLASYWLHPISPCRAGGCFKPFTAASCDATALFESLLVLAAPGYRPDFGW